MISTKYHRVGDSILRICYIRLMALAALYKWITSIDQVDQVELDQLIELYPFAQNLQIVKALSQLDLKSDLTGQLHSLEPSWYNYIRLDLKEDKVDKGSAVATVGQEVDDSQLILDSDVENRIAKKSDTKLIVYEVPWTENEVLEDQVDMDWTTSETLFFESSSRKKLPSEEDFDSEDPGIISEADEIEKNVSLDNNDDKINQLVPSLAELIDLSDDSSPSESIKKDNAIVPRDRSVIADDVKLSPYSRWLLMLKPCPPPRSLVDIKSNQINKEKAVEENAVEENADDSNNLDKANKESIRTNERAETDTNSALEKSDKKSNKKKKKKKPSKKSARLKRANKNKKLKQKLRKKKRKKEKLKLKKKKLKKEDKLRRAKKAKKKNIKLKKKKKSQRSIETILKNKASNKKKKRRKNVKKSNGLVDGKPNKKGNFDLRLASEPLANLLWLQGHRKKAIKMFGDLGLKMPEKKTYFAAQIEKLKKKKK